MALAIAAVTVAIVCCCCSCVFRSSVPDKYYEYDYDIASSEGRQIATACDGAAVTLQTVCYGRYSGPFGSQVITSNKYVSTAFYVSEDGWLVTPLHGVRGNLPRNYTVVRYDFTLFYETTDLSGNKVILSSSATVNADEVYTDEEYDLALVFLPATEIFSQGRKWVDVSEENCARADVGESLYVFSTFAEDTSSLYGYRLISAASVGNSSADTPFNISAERLADWSDNNYSFNYDATATVDYCITGDFSVSDVGGYVVNSQGKTVGIIGSRILDPDSFEQSEDIYGLAAMTDISRVRTLMTEAGAL